MALNNSKLLSGRVVVTPYPDLSNSRYEFLGLSQAEPNLGTGANGSILTISTDNQRVFSNVITVSSNTSTATITNLGVTGNTNLGAVGNLTITGGNVGYVLTTDGAGNLSWQEGTSNGVPGGSNTQVQFNSNGVFGGSSSFTFDNSTGAVNVNADLTANSLTIGSGIYQFSRTSMFFATTISSAPQQILALDAEGLAGVDLVIISTDATNNSRQITKLSIVIYDGVLSYNDTSTLAVNNYLSEFSVNYVSVDNEIQINCTPAFANFMDHKMQIVAYNE
jgi:hypothetical protein